MDFAKLKSLSGKKSLEILSSELSKITSSSEKKNDGRFWQPTVDKAGNGYAVIRFLPAPADEDVPFIRIFSHAFQGPTGIWYIENSLNTIGQADPVAEFNTKLWNSVDSDESAERKQVRKQKRKLTYYANIYIEQDSNNPENEGKVKLYKFGKKIFDKINESINPAFDDEEPMNPFDLWNGASFKLKIRNVEGYRNYDKSEFGKPGPIAKTDEEIEAIWKQTHSLQEFLDVKNFKTYDELKQKLARVLDTKVTVEKAENLIPAESPFIKEVKAPSIKESPFKDDEVDSYGDEDLALFRKLAK